MYNFLSDIFYVETFCEKKFKLQKWKEKTYKNKQKSRKYYKFQLNTSKIA